MSSERPDWTEAFQRTVLVSALRGGLLSRLNGSFSADLFGSPTSPRARIAELIGQYFNDYGVLPADGELDELLARERGSQAEKQALSAEWNSIREAAVPAETKFVEEKILDWVSRQRIIQTLLAAADRAATDDLGQLREFISEGISAPEAQDARPEVRLVADGAERVALWASGEEYGEPIPTGFAALDAAMGGGPRRGECHYFAAPPKGAKTTALTNIAINAVRRRFNVYLVTFEMRAHRILLRADRTLTRSSREELRDEPERLGRALRGLAASGAGELWAWEAPPLMAHACDEVYRRIQLLKREGIEIDLLVMDYLNIMGSAKQEKEKRHELARISREMAALTRSLNVVMWSAVLVNRASVDKEKIRKTDIAEAFEVVAVVDGMTAICSSREMREAGLGSLYIAAMREEEDERLAGTYRIDRKRGLFLPYYEQPAAPLDDALPSDR